MLISAGLLFISLLILKDSIRNPAIAFCFSFYSFLILFLLAIHIVCDRLTGNGIDESVLYFINSEKYGADFLPFWKEMLLSLVFMAICFSLSMVVFFTLLNNQIKNIKYSRFILFIIFSSGAIYSNPGIKDLYQLYVSSKSIVVSGDGAFGSHLRSENSLKEHEIKLKNKKKHRLHLS